MGDESLAFLNPGLPKRIQAPSNQPSPESASTMRLGDGEVIQVSATPIVSAETGSDESAFLEGDEAAPAIPAQKRAQVLARV